VEKITNPRTPVLEGEAAAAVKFRDGHVQIVAAAGSGKTEVVSQRIASLLTDDVAPDEIVAFTFTDKAAAEMKERIRQRVSDTLGGESVDMLGRLFVGTIHAYCLRLLQDTVPVYETYTSLDDPQLTAFLYREAKRLNLSAFDSDGQTFSGIKNFKNSIAAVENELMPLDSLPDGDFKTAARAYYDTLHRYRFLSFGTQIVEAVHQLSDPDVHARVSGHVKHLIVDEYQDINPAQEELIRLLTRPVGAADLTVVGDDDQAIYQWRGSNVSNILTFTDRYPNVTTFHLLTNRRSRPEIVRLANTFVDTIQPRLKKQMDEHRPANGVAVTVSDILPNEATEAALVAELIRILHESGVPYHDMAILVRGGAAYPQLLSALASVNIPLQEGERGLLFRTPEAETLGMTYCWLAGVKWKQHPRWSGQGVSVTIEQLLNKYHNAFGLTDSAALRDHLESWKTKTTAEKPDWNPNLVGDFYALLQFLGVQDWSLDDAHLAKKMALLGRFSHVLLDYESSFERATRDADSGAYVGGVPGGKSYYRGLARMIVSSGTAEYKDFPRESSAVTDGVYLGTVHSAKGLQWPVVFLPSLTDRRFPSSLAGQVQTWLLPRESFDAVRYEGGEMDERRLFYVALTRARDWVWISSHGAEPSPYYREAKPFSQTLTFPTGVEPLRDEEGDLNVTYSDLAAYINCPRSYRLRKELGFEPPINKEIGYGNAVHHVLRVLAEEVRVDGKLPTPAQVDARIDSDFFLPYAGRIRFEKLQAKARKLIFTYLNQYQADLRRTWATERPFELYLPGVVIAGRADVIFDNHDGMPDNLAIVDYKTSTMSGIEPLQLQIYADAGRREGLTVGAAYIHDLDATQRHSVDISDAAIATAEDAATAAARSLKGRDFTPRPTKAKCKHCDVRAVCGAAFGTRP